MLACQRFQQYILLSLLLLGLDSPACFSQATTEESAPQPVTQTQVDELRGRLESSKDLDDSVKTSITSLLEEVTTDLQSAESSARDAAAFQEQIDSAAANVDSANKTLENPPESEPLPNATQSESLLQQQLVEKQAALADAEKKVALAVSEPSRRQARLLAIPDEQSKLEQSLAEARKQVLATGDTGDLPLLADARSLRSRAKVQSIAAKLNMLQKEAVAYKATSDLLPLQRQLAENEVKRLQQQIKALQNALAGIRQAQIDTLRGRVAKAAKDASPTLVKVAKTNVDLLDQYEQMASRGQVVADKLRDTRKQLEDVKNHERTTVDRVAAVGLTEVLELHLQREKTQLQRLQVDYRPDPDLRKEIQTLLKDTFAWEDEATQASTTQASTTALAAPSNQGPSNQEPANQGPSNQGPSNQGPSNQEPSNQGPSNQEPASEQVSDHDLLSLKAEILRKLVPVSSTLFQDLVSLDTAQRQLRDVIDRYLDFIEENLLWTRNAPYITAVNPSASLGGIAWLISGENWSAVPAALASDFRRRPFIVVCMLLLLGTITFARSKFRRTIITQGEIAKRASCVVVEPTFHATYATIMLAAPVPLALAGLAWLIAGSGQRDEFLISLTWGLGFGALFLTPIILLRQICRGEGLGINHFRWPESVCKRVRQACGDLAAVGGPLAIIMVMLHLQSDESISDSLGRYLVIALMVIFVAEAYQLLRPSLLWSEHLRSTSLLFRYRRIIYSIAMLIPIGITLLVALGYEYMTFAVMHSVALSVIALLVIAVLQSIAMRVLLIRRRRLSIAQSKQRRAAMADTDAVETAGINVTVPEVDFGSVSQRAQQLVRLLGFAAGCVAIGWIWSDLLPALGMLDRVPISPIETADGNPRTLRDLLFAILTIGLTIYAVKNLPAMVELFFLQPLEPGARYAVSTMLCYAIGSVGLILGLNFLSIPWSQLSWILAAASVGLGFGLQEILANFVSGIILLLEQPIRVGDIVTVDNSTGVVTKMQIRATTVTNWDRQELIIPNKDLVTGKLLNWTLSNVINRVVINVGVAYGSEPENVRNVLLGAVKNHPEVLKDPAPIVTFEQFGDSSLNFVIRCYLPSLEKRLLTIHELHSAIARALTSAEIEIPFPQRDIHLTIEPSGPSLDSIVPRQG